MGNPEFSVCQFLSDGSHEYVRRFVTAKEAVEAAHHYCTSVGAVAGLVERVIIIDGGDHTVFQWVKGVGVTWPESLTDVTWPVKGEQP